MIKRATVHGDSASISLSRHPSDSISMALTPSKEVNTSNLVVNKNFTYLTQGTWLVNVSNVFQIAHSLWIAFYERASLVGQWLKFC